MLSFSSFTSSSSAHPQFRLRLALFVLVMAVAGLAACSGQSADSISGVWRAVVLNKAGEEIAFKLEIEGKGGQITGALINGDQRVVSTGGSFDGKILKLQYDFYDGELTATLTNGELRGDFKRQSGKNTLSRELRAWRESTDAAPDTAPAADLSGDWLLRVGEGDNQRTWRASFKQQNSAVSGTIIPLSGDWGTMTGKFENGELRLTRFDGINAYLLKAKLTAAGKLEGLINSERKVVAERADKAQLAALPPLPDPNNYTKLKNPAEPFQFSFPDLDGKTVSSNDERFRNKVVIVTIGGTWCPNCHEEAAVLRDFWQRYQKQGLEIVGLMFEYTGEAARDREQMRIFARRHNIAYPLLLAGTTEEGEVQKKLPQLENFSAYPTAIFIGRDGRVKRIHAGFEGQAAGARHTQLKAELEEYVEELLDSSKAGS
ncbi:MAG: TlpA disulfide reductase family protein [Acidobacteriota bacterium]|nr:TlpA disulfide reductase family protein [Acidobacteriota bacterium]